MMILLVLFTLSLIVSVSCADLPNYFPRCYRNDNDLESCLIDGSEKLKPYLKIGFPEFNVPSIDLLILEAVDVSQKGLDFEYEAHLFNFTFRGLTNYTFEELRFQPDNLTVHGRVICPVMSIAAKARFDGTIVVVPVNADTELEFVMGPTVANFIIEGKLEKRDKEDYFLPKRVKTSLTIADGYMGKFVLLNASAYMSELTRMMFNANSELITSKLAVAYEEISDIVASSLLQKFTKEVPYNKILPVL